MEMLIERLWIAAALATAVIALAIAYRGRILTAWGGHLAGVLHTTALLGVVLVLNGLVRTYIF